MMPPADSQQPQPPQQRYDLAPQSGAPSLPPVTTQPLTPAPVSPGMLADAVRRVEHEKSRRRWGRRAFLGVVGIGACCAVAEVAPLAIRDVGLYTKQQLDQALASGITQGREAVLAELRNIEGVALTDAIEVADLTRRGVTNYVKPLADLAAKLSGDALAGLAQVVGFARDHVPNATVLGLNVHDGLDNLAQVLTVWDANVSTDPLGTYAVQDVTKAEAYLKALQRTIYGTNSGAGGTATPGS
ncbi:MAG: hypothetical protein ACHQ4H_02335 [Ktedonobacterales bacterium]